MSSPTPPALRTVWRNTPPHNGGVAHGALAVSPSGEWIAAGTSAFPPGGQPSGSLVLFDARGGDVLRSVSGDWQVRGLAISPDSRWVVVSEGRLSEPSRIRVVEAATLGERCRYAGTLDRSAENLTFTADSGTVLATFPAAGATTLVAFDAASGAERWRRDVTTTSVAYGADAASVVLGSDTAGVLVLDALTGAERLRITPPFAARRCLLSPDHRWVLGENAGVVSGFDTTGTTVAWSVRPAPDGFRPSTRLLSDDARFWVDYSFQGEVHHAIGVHELTQGTPRFRPVMLPKVKFGNAVQLRYSPTLRHIVANCPPGGPISPLEPPFLTVLDARTGRQLSVNKGPYSTIALSADGATLAGWNGRLVEVLDLGLEVSRGTVDASPTSIDLSPSGTPLVAVADTGSAVTVITAATGTVLARRPIPGNIAATVFAEGGAAVATGGSAGVRLFSVVADRFWTVENIGPVNALAAVGSAGSWIATAAGRTVRLLSSIDGHERWATAVTHPQSVTRVAASADGAWIATGCADRTTRILDTATGAQRFAVTGDGKVRALAFQPNRTLLGTANEDGSIVLVEAATATERGRIQRLIGCAHLAFGLDGAVLATAWDDNTVSIYDLSGAGPPPKVREFPFAAPITSLAVNPVDGSVAVTLAGSTAVVVRDPRTGIEPVRILAPSPVRDAAISADGTLLATVGDDRVVRVWQGSVAPQA
jgi:WD40 repeat protein